MGSTGNLSKTLNFDTISAIDNYIQGKGNNFNSNQIKDIKDNMKESNNSLFRVEDSSWSGDSVKVGDIFTFDKDIKSFTDSQSGIDNVIVEGDDAGLYENNIVIYKTVGNISSLDVKQYSKFNSEEDEHFVSGKFKVIKKRRGKKIRGYNTIVIEIQQLRK